MTIAITMPMLKVSPYISTQVIGLLILPGVSLVQRVGLVSVCRVLPRSPHRLFVAI